MTKVSDSSLAFQKQKGHFYENSIRNRQLQREVADLGNLEKKYDDPSTLRGVQPYSVDEANAKRLWKLSEEITGITI